MTVNDDMTSPDLNLYDGMGRIGMNTRWSDGRGGEVWADGHTSLMVL